MRVSNATSLVMVVAALSLAGCAHAPTVEHRDLAAYAGPILSTDTALGATEFQTHCNDCHPGGEAGYGKKLNGENLDPAEVRQHVREGKGRMPAFSTAEVSDQDLEAILAYLVTKGAVAAPAAPSEAAPATPAEATPPAQ